MGVLPTSKQAEIVEEACGVDMDIMGTQRMGTHHSKGFPEEVIPGLDLEGEQEPAE